MKRALPLAAGLLLGLVGFASPARADWQIGFGIGVGGGYVGGSYYHGPHHVYRPVHVHCPVPVYRQVWVPPVYERVVVGYTRWGEPVRRKVLVSPGYHKTVIVGYTCRSCGVACP
jgi:hypothetical protein